MSPSANGHEDTRTTEPARRVPRPRRRISLLAVASLMIGLVSFLGLAFPVTITHWDWAIQKGLMWPPTWSLAGFVLGLAAILSIGWSRGRLGGKGYAYAGTAVSALVLVLAVEMWISFFYPAYLEERAEPARDACMSRVWLLTMAATAYAQDFADTLPPADSWSDAILPYANTRDDFVCPAAPELECGYAYNRALDSRPLSSISDAQHVVMFYESDLGWNGSGGPESVVAKPRHLDARMFGFVDGSRLPVYGERESELVWEPKASPAE